MLKLFCFATLLVVAFADVKYANEFVRLPGHKVRNDYSLPLPSTYINSVLPDNWDWNNINGTSYITPNRNQHIPQYCGSCWAHGAMSALADRVKIARRSTGVTIFPAIQFILNCGTEIAGSCHGGSHTGAYEFVKKTGFIPFDDCLQYEACSSESQEGNCPHGNYECSLINTCRTCSTFTDMGGKCVGLDTFPNVTIAEYGEISGEEDIMKEIYARGPVACGVNATPLHDFLGGIFDNKREGTGINHIVSITGWGLDKKTGKKYWIVRNSWGSYWAENGFFRIVRGENQLGIEETCAWATPGSWTTVNFPCTEDGGNCQKKEEYVDPAIVPAWHMA